MSKPTPHDDSEPPHDDHPHDKMSRRGFFQRAAGALVTPVAIAAGTGLGTYILHKKRDNQMQSIDQLLLAIEKRDIAAVKAAIDEGGDVNGVSFETSQGYERRDLTALCECVRQMTSSIYEPKAGDATITEIAQLLLANKADPNLKESHGGQNSESSPISILLSKVFKTPDIDMKDAKAFIDALVEGRVNLDLRIRKPLDDGGYTEVTPLSAALDDALNYHVKQHESFDDEAKARHLMAYEKLLDIARYVIFKGADVNDADKRNMQVISEIISEEWQKLNQSSRTSEAASEAVSQPGITGNSNSQSQGTSAASPKK